MASPGGHNESAVHRSPFGDGRVLAWILVVAFALALYTVYEYWRTGTFGNTYFLAAFAVLATLVLATVFLAVRPSSMELENVTLPIRGEAEKPQDPPSHTQPQESSPPEVRFVRRTVAFDGGPVHVVRSDYDVHGMPTRDYELVTGEGSFSIDRLEVALDAFSLEPLFSAAWTHAESTKT